jgi:hypothetical protein
MLFEFRLSPACSSKRRNEFIYLSGTKDNLRISFKVHVSFGTFLTQEKYIEIIQNYYTDGLYLFAVNEDVNVRYMLGIIKTEGDKNYLTRKCERLDKEIDQLVYQLYGLTEACPPKVYRRRKEIKIVEEK